MPDSARPAAILVVDDNAANRALARETLEDEGYRVILAENGPEALEAFARERPDCVLLDVRMPEMDGFEVCRRIRASGESPDVPVLFLTALRDVDTFDRALVVGGDDFLTKPIRPAELVVRVQTALRVRRLGAELQDQYATLKRQRDDLMRLQLQKERLTAFVVHDLKNPVNAMDLHAQLLLRDRALPEGARRSAARIRTDARQLTRMILNLLDLSKADEGQLLPRLAPVDLPALAAAVLGELEVMAESHRAELRHAIEVERVQVDEDLFRRTLTNLVENAIRHAPPNTTVTLSARRAPGGTEIRIADAGKGVPVEQRDKVFDPFVQLASGPADAPVTRGGRGLGLAFCRLVVEAHGGTIRVEDADPGAVFCVTIPDSDGER